MKLAFIKTSCFTPELDHSAKFLKGKTNMTNAFGGKYFKLYLGTAIHFVASILYNFFLNFWCFIVPFQKYNVHWGKTNKL